jgi:hypothetical protein
MCMRQPLRRPRTMRATDLGDQDYHSGVAFDASQTCFSRKKMCVNKFAGHYL